MLAAGNRSTPQSDRALEELCRSYWFPLYAYVRRRGHTKEDAEDLTQAFFARFLEKNYLAGLSAECGRFRAFLLASLKHFLINEWDKSRRQKRGGEQLRAECESDGRGKQFAELKVFLTAGKGELSHADAAKALGLDEGAVRVAVHRLRKRYRQLLRDEIAQTLADSADVDEEMRALFGAFM